LATHGIADCGRGRLPRWVACSTARR
jgi:hypothetical protein